VESDYNHLLTCSAARVHMPTF